MDEATRSLNSTFNVFFSLHETVLFQYCKSQKKLGGGGEDRRCLAIYHPSTPISPEPHNATWTPKMLATSREGAEGGNKKGKKKKKKKTLLFLTLVLQNNDSGCKA